MPLADDEFLSKVGHDLRGELATVVAGVHYLLRYEADLGDSARQMLERVNGAGQRMKRLLDEFDNAAWISGGDASQLTTGPCRAADLVAQVLERLASQIAARSVRVEVDVPAGLPTFTADGELLGAALEYVADFAITRSAGGLVRVRGIAGERVQLRFEDLGGPVDPDRLPHVFDPFVEKELASRPAAGGAKRRERLGLGLAIARGIFTAQGGSASAEAGADGLAFVLTAPP